ncbi:MAG: sigma-54 dependent transcriptional regulator, partial [Desulfobacteraceae bacterium]|nr:sigma-54 dependent transcriptional regulator [Desulfobacteraceae bacterium]
METVNTKTFHSPKVLIIDDDAQVCDILTTVFSRMGHTASFALTLQQGLGKIATEIIDVVFLDVNLPDGNGLLAIETIQKMPDAPEIIIFTGNEDVDGAELAMRTNAWDYISKSESHKKCIFALNRALEYRRQKRNQKSAVSFKRSGIIGESPPVLDCLDKVAKAAKHHFPVVITGETGTGKELFSRAIHANSSRSHAAFVVVDCAALPEHLVESTLFGHAKGAFTGADTSHTGLMKMADKGTLFLDEVGELPLAVQKSFLRAIQEKQFRPVGAADEIKSDFRLICATHRNLQEMVKDNRFREDLYFRLFSMHIHLPPLQSRKSDVEALVQDHLSRKYDRSKGKGVTVSEDFLEELQTYDWPGNVRELINTLDLVCSDTGFGDTLFAHHLPAHIRTFHVRSKFTSSSPAASPISSGNPLQFKVYMEKMKLAYLQDLLSATKGNIAECCRRSG